MTVSRKVMIVTVIILGTTSAAIATPFPFIQRSSSLVLTSTPTLSSVCSNGSTGSGDLVLETTPTPNSGALLFDCGTDLSSSLPLPAFSVSSSSVAIPTFATQGPSGSTISLAIDPIPGSQTRGDCAGTTTTITNGTPVSLTSSDTYDYCLSYSGFPSYGGSIPSFTTTWSLPAPSVSQVECGHNLSCAVQSNATLTKIRFAGNTIHVEADGTPGAYGFANVTVPKPSIPNINQLHVFVDNNKLSSSAVTITSNSTTYFIYFTFTFHSPVLIDIQLATPESAPSLILGLDPALFYEIGATVAVIVTISTSLVIRRARRTRPTT